MHRCRTEISEERYRSVPVRRAETDLLQGVEVLTLDRLELGAAATVVAVFPHVQSPEWCRWLEEIGFILGEQVQLLARGPLGGDPLAVRVGNSTFALRRAEAACVQVEVRR